MRTDSYMGVSFLLFTLFNILVAQSLIFLGDPFFREGEEGQKEELPNKYEGLEALILKTKISPCLSHQIILSTTNPRKNRREWAASKL